MVFSQLHGINSCKIDPTMMHKKTSASCGVLAIYVDDILLIGSDEAGISTINASLQTHLAKRDLRTLRYFLGIEFVCQ